MIDPSDAQALRKEAERRWKLRKEGKSLNGVVGSPEPGIDYSRTPLHVRLPWSVLVPDNEKYGVSGGKIILTERYRAAKSRIRAAARDQVESVTGNRAFMDPCAILAKVYVPNTRTRDVANFAKLVHDALETVCYTNDSLLYDVHWIRAGVDVDAPRVEITVSLIAA